MVIPVILKRVSPSGTPISLPQGGISCYYATFGEWHGSHGEIADIHTFLSSHMLVIVGP